MSGRPPIMHANLVILLVLFFAAPAQILFCHVVLTSFIDIENGSLD